MSWNPKSLAARLRGLLTPSTRGGRGRRGEALARRHLEGLGFTFEAANVRVGAGELDLVMRDGPAWVFAEVKYRTKPVPERFRHTVSAAQKRRIRAAAHSYLRGRGLTSQPSLRFDIVLIEALPDGDRVHHLPAAF